MLTEKLASLLNRVLAQYDSLQIASITQSVINALRARDANQGAGYTNNRNSVLQTIHAAREKLDISLDRIDVISFFENSDYDCVLPRDILKRLENMLPTNMAIAATSPEAQLVHQAFAENHADFTNTVTLLKNLKVSEDATTRRDDHISFALSFPSLIIDHKFDLLATVTEEISELIKITSSYFIQEEEVAYLRHVSMSNLLYYFDLTKDYAPVFIEIWRACLETAKLILSQKNFLKQARDNGMTDQMIENIQETATATTEAHLAKAIESIGVEMVSEGLSGDIKLRVSRSVQKVSGRILEGAAMIVETEMHAAVNITASSEKENIRKKAEELQKIMLQVQEMQTQISLSAESNRALLRIQQQ